MDQSIFRNGKVGAILIALMDKKPIGTCAFIKMDNETYEFAKMVVSSQNQGQKIGWKNW